MADSHSPNSDPDDPDQHLANGSGRDGESPANDGVDRAESDAADRPWHTRDEEPKKSGSLLREVAIIVLCVLLITWVLQTFVGRQYVIPSESMEPTLTGCEGCANDRIVVDKLAYRFGDPEAGDVIVFKVPDTWGAAWLSPRSDNAVVRTLQDGMSWFGFAPPDENNYVKRIIATGGQTVECTTAEGVGVKVDGQPLVEPYVDLELQARTIGGGVTAEELGGNGRINNCLGPDFGPVTVPDDSLWVMGDNRTSSADSRVGGTVPVADVRGKTRWVVYPFSRMGGVGSVDPQHAS